MTEVIEHDGALLDKTPVDYAVSIAGIISSAAINPQCDIEKMQALLAMQTEIMDREARAQFNAAMIAASGEIPQIERLGRASMGGKGSYAFARWEDMDRAIRPILTRHGLRLSFTTNRLDDGSVVVVGTASHLNGQNQSAEFTLPADKGPGRNEAQSFGSSLTYGKRYCAEMLLNIVRCDEDNDGASPMNTQAPATITASQKKEIVGLLQETGVDEKAFYAWVGCRTLDQMKAQHFPRAKSVLQERLSPGEAK